MSYYYSRNKEDSLPKVIICGITEQNIPKLLVCEDQNPAEERICAGSCNQRSTEERAPPSLSKRPVDMQQLMTNKLQADLYLKNQTIENLTQTLCHLECQMEVLSKQNAMLNEKIERACAIECKPAGSRNMNCLESRLEEYSESTKMLEKQVTDMENHVKAIKNELSVVQAERAKLERERKNIIMVCPSRPACPRPSLCR